MLPHRIEIINIRFYVFILTIYCKYNLMSNIDDYLLYFKNKIINFVHYFKIIIKFSNKILIIGHNFSIMEITS